MAIQRHSPSRSTPSRHSGLPLLLYDLGAASHHLPLAAVLPEQFHTPPPGRDTTSGEVALMRAVLEDALGCFQKQFVKNGRRALRLAREAEEWFFTDDPHWPFSFINICAVLNLDPGYLRMGIQRWHQRYASQPVKTRRRAVPTRRALKIAA